MRKGKLFKNLSTKIIVDLSKQPVMKGFFVLLFCATAATASAQRTNAELEKLFEKNKTLLQKVTIQAPMLHPGSSKSYTAGVYPLPQDQMPCVVPDTKAIVAIPNALPTLSIPEIAAIPNPARKHTIVKSEPIQPPASK